MGSRWRKATGHSTKRVGKVAEAEDHEADATRAASGDEPLATAPRHEGVVVEAEDGEADVTSAAGGGEQPLATAPINVGEHADAQADEDDGAAIPSRRSETHKPKAKNKPAGRAAGRATRFEQ